MLQRAACLRVAVLTCLLASALVGIVSAEEVRQATLAGVVRTPDGQPAAGAHVELHPYLGGGGPDWAVTGPDGRFRVAGLWPGRYRILVEGSLVADVGLPSDADTSTLTLTAPPPLVVSGVVRDAATGRPLAGAWVMANPPTRVDEIALPERPNLTESSPYEWARVPTPDLLRRSPAATRTDAEGRYRLRLGYERGSVLAVAPHRALFPGWWRMPPTGRDARHDFALSPVAAFLLRGRVLLPSGQPLAHAHASLGLPWKTERRLPVETDADGRYAVLPGFRVAGRVRLYVNGYLPLSQRLTEAQGAWEPPPAMAWRLVVPPPQGRLELRVVREDGRPVAGEVSVSVHAAQTDDLPVDGQPGVFHGHAPAAPPSNAAGPPAPGPPAGEADADASYGLQTTVTVHDGRGELAVEPWRYEVSLPQPPLGSEPVAQSRWCQVVEVSPGATARCELVEPVLSSLTVKALAETGRPEPNVLLRARRWCPEASVYSGPGVRTEADGTVHFTRLLAGTYLIDVEPEPEGRVAVVDGPAVVAVGTGTSSQVVLHLRRVRPPAPPSAPTTTLTGRVWLPGGRSPAAHTAVYVTDPDAGPADLGQPTWTGRDGRFAVTAALGARVVWAQGDGSALTPLGVQVTARPSPVRLVLQWAAGVSGRVEADPERTYDDLWVAVLPLITVGDDDVLDSPSWAPVRRDGTFELHGLPPGDATLGVCQRRELEPASVVTVALKPRETRRNLVLHARRPSPGFELRLVGADGAALPSPEQVDVYHAYGASLGCGSCGDSPRSLLPGEYDLWLPPEGHGLAARPGLLVRGVEVQPGRPTPLDLAISAAGGIRGRAVGADGRPLPGAPVAVHVPGPLLGTGCRGPDWVFTALRHPRLPSYATAWTAPDGVFELVGLAPGRYQVALRDPTETCELAVSPPVEVTAGKLTELGVLRADRP